MEAFNILKLAPKRTPTWLLHSWLLWNPL